ncbi:MAG: UbiD family decarboxylase, partial [Alistipes sp.]|nr:UbiD family decarboxylase [Alistipes sp.]
KLVKSLTNNIWIPADCDFVIEGFVDTLADKTIEGPFGDHTGFYSLCDLYPVLHVTAITHRRDAVWPATLVGIPPKEDFFISKATEKIFLTPIRLALLPELRDLYMPPQGVSHNMAIVSLAVRYPGHAKQALSAMWGAGQMMFNKYMIVAPEGTDIRDHNALAALLRGVDFSTAVVRSDGVL